MPVWGKNNDPRQRERSLVLSSGTRGGGRLTANFTRALDQCYNPLMRAILPFALGPYSYVRMGYANPHAVTSVGGTTYSYDNNGNVISIGSLDYTGLAESPSGLTQS
jgi:hypothetical protein